MAQAKASDSANFVSTGKDSVPDQRDFRRESRANHEPTSGLNDHLSGIVTRQRRNSDTPTATRSSN